MICNVPNSFGSVVREFNSCHLPAGRSDGGQFCSRDEAVRRAGFSPDAVTPENLDQIRAVERAWNRKMSVAVSQNSRRGSPRL